MGSVPPSLPDCSLRLPGMHGRHLSICHRDRRKQALLEFLHRTRQRLLRLHVLALWGDKTRAFGAISGTLDAAARHADAARDAADQLAHTHQHITGTQVQSPRHCL